MTKMADQNPTARTTGSVLHWAAGYDLLAWLLLLGRERVFRDKIVRLARLQPGESVLDVGCGTGTLAIAAKQCVGPTGSVHGIDPSPEMIARAAKKARKAGVEAVFKNGIAEALPFPDAHFDVILSTLMLHHLPGEARLQCVREMQRVLKPGGRMLAVDFGGSESERRSLLGYIHRHIRFDLRDVIDVLRDAGLNCVDSGPVGVNDLQFVLAAARPARDHSLCDQGTEDRTMKGHGSLSTHPWMIPAVAVGLIAGPVILYYLLSHTALVGT